MMVGWEAVLCWAEILISCREGVRPKVVDTKEVISNTDAKLFAGAGSSH